MGRACRQLSAVIPIDKSANDRFGFNTAADLFDKLISLTSKNLSSDFRKTQDDMPGLLNKKFLEIHYIALKVQFDTTFLGLHR